MSHVMRWLLMCAIAATLVAIAAGVAGMVTRPCHKLVQGRQVAAVGGALAQYYDDQSGDGSNADDPLYDSAGYIKEPCYDTSYTEPTYGETYYYEPSDTYDYGYSSGYYYTSGPTYTQTLPSTQMISGSSPSLTETIVPIGVPTGGVNAAQAPTQTWQSTVTAPSSTVYQPTCSMSTQPSSVPYGGSTVVSWTSNNATSVVLDGVGNMSQSGSYTFSNISTTQAFRMTVSGKGGTGVCSANVGIQPQVYRPAVQVSAQMPSCVLSAYPSIINAWQNASLSWGSQGATSAYLSNVGSVPVNGGIEVSPGSSSTYTLTVQDASGRNAVCSTNVIVLSNPPPLQYQAPSCYISTSLNQVTAGDLVVVSWGSSDATSASLNGVGNVGTTGSYQFTPENDQAYVLNVSGPGGASTCSTYVSVKPRPAPAPVVQTPAAPTCNISADAASIFEGGSAKLVWSSSHATKASIDGIGAVEVTGSRSVSPKSTQKYTLTTTGEGGTRSCSVTITVQSPTACTTTCNGVTYACAPVATPVSATCPQTGATSAAPSSSAGVLHSVWQWLVSIF